MTEREAYSVDAIFFEDPGAFRNWLGQNHDRATELWLGLYKKNSGRTGISYAEALDQALCFGWIDGKVRSLGELSYAIRFTPRKLDSIWSQTNIKRVGELSELGLMHPAGLERFNSRRPDRERIYSHEADPVELDPAYEATLRANEPAWNFFTAQAPTYQRVVKHWVMGAKREETRLKRLNALIESSAGGRRLPQFTSPGTRTSQ
jgi:uncharacterized protein YdeI (YjbR/CyaY-like superfamily)